MDTRLSKPARGDRRLCPNFPRWETRARVHAARVPLAHPLASHKVCSRAGREVRQQTLSAASKGRFPEPCS
jgi:hypothetical protein